ncbi:MAG TPA: hypothetical protein VFJ85_06295 [Acidimicrobiales bacterium]|nr:hypothetical protein [Acidimicrobiales bacterium]
MPITTTTTAAPVPTTTAAPGPIRLEDGVADLRSGVAAEEVEMVDNGVFTDDVAKLALYQEPGEFSWARGLAAPPPGVVNVAVAAGGHLVCLTTSTDDGVLAASYLLSETTREVRLGRGPIGSCTAAGVRGLPRT